MGSVPQHPFFLNVIDSLQSYDHHWILPYITVMYSTGPLFLSICWKRWMTSRSATDTDRVRILMRDEYNRYSWSFFTYHKGSSWHGKDAQFVIWMSQNWIILSVIATSILGIGFALYRCYTRGAAVGDCSWLPWPFNRITALCNRFSIRVRGGHYFPLPNPASSQDYDNDAANIKLSEGDEFNHGRRRMLVASAQSQQYPYNEKQDPNMVNNMSYSLTPTHSNASSSTVISEAPAEHEQPHYASQDHLAPASATNAYPTQGERSSSRLQLPTLSSFLPRKLGRSREHSPATRPPSSSSARSGCGLTGEDIEAQTTLSRHPSYSNERSSPMDLRETWAREDTRRQR